MSATPIRSLTLLTFAAMFGFGVAHCAGKVPALPAEVSETIGPLGGIVATSNGTQIYVPPGALTSTATITMQNVPSAPLLTQGTAVGQAILCGPEGEMFADPVTITLAFKASELPLGKTVNDIVIYTAPVGSPDYTSLVTTIASDNQHVVAQTTHFSYFVPIIPFPETAHPDSGVDGTVDFDTGTFDNDTGQPPDTSTPPPPPQDTGTVDSTVDDTGPTTTDSATDTGTPDAGSDAADAAQDTGSVSDTGSAPPDTGPADTGSPDTGSADTGVHDSGSATDTGSAVSDTGSGGSETGGADAGDDSD